VSTDSATKSAKTWDLMAFRGANEIVSPMISTAHFAILPEASQHWMISPREKDDTKVTR
jgi:ABC-type taurine transport system substrate-binding protein